MRIVTSGFQYVDIDAYSCIVAYSELLNKINVPARAVSTGAFNASIPQVVVEWGAVIDRQFTPDLLDTFSIVDVSNPDHFETFVSHQKIYEVIDHHPGFLEYWTKKLGDMAQIEPIGSCASQIYGKWKASGLVQEMSQTSARLLLTAILDNTLNFQALITDNRDRQAYLQLLPRVNLPEEWTDIYFTACQAQIMSNFDDEVVNDTKWIEFQGLNVLVGQLALWNANQVLNKYADIVKILAASQNKNWFMNIVDLKRGISYILCEQKSLQALLARVMQIDFIDNVAISDRCWLRKEIWTSLLALNE